MYGNMNVKLVGHDFCVMRNEALKPGRNLWTFRGTCNFYVYSNWFHCNAGDL